MNAMNSKSLNYEIEMHNHGRFVVYKIKKKTLRV